MIVQCSDLRTDSSHCEEEYAKEFLPGSDRDDIGNISHIRKLIRKHKGQTRNSSSPSNPRPRSSRSQRLLSIQIVGHTVPDDERQPDLFISPTFHHEYISSCVQDVHRKSDITATCNYQQQGEHYHPNW
jgi:hypothetical protein